MPSLLFASQHCYLDYASGAAVSLRDLLVPLGQRGWDCQVFCGSALDAPSASISEILSRQTGPVDTRQRTAGPVSYSLHQFSDNGVSVTIYQPAQFSTPIKLEEGYPFLQLLDSRLKQRRPDVLLSFGGGWMARAILAVARRHRVPTVFWLRNFEYKFPDLFEPVDGAIVPSNSAASYFESELHFNRCKVIPSPIRSERVICKNRQPKFVTFIGPRPEKGVFYFARIASELGRIRPDIPVLVVVGRGKLSFLAQSGLNLRALPNFRIMRATPDARPFLSITRVILAPSLWKETFMRVLAEGMMNGIPSLVSRRGGVAETLGNCGFLFDIPEQYTAQSRQIPSAAEVQPWVQTIQKLWDDPCFYENESAKCVAEARRFSLDAVVGQHEQYLNDLIRDRTAPPPGTIPSLADEMSRFQRFFNQPMQLNRFDDL